jgi:hypothetical protein
MTTTHDDYPHPVPQLAHLRWKENWLFVVMAPDQNVYGVIHVNTEPTFDRARFTCNLSVRGRVYKYTNETGFPALWGAARELQDRALKMRFTQPHHRFDIDLDTPELNARLVFENAHPTFDFAACRSAAPENPSFKELMTLGTQLPHDHHQQALTLKGTLSLKEAGDRGEIKISGLGYRDHSWCMRGDSLIAHHTFSALLFQERVLGVKTAAMLSRPGTLAREGYVSDQEGARVLRTIDVEIRESGPDGLGEHVLFKLCDVYGRSFTIEANIADRVAHVPLVSEKPGVTASYRIVENLCPIKLLETGETGLGHVELGLNPQIGNSRP